MARTLIFRKTIRLFAALFMVAASSANTTKSPADASIISVGLLMSQYMSSHEGRHPENWAKFIESGFLSGDSLRDARKLNNIEDRYFFPGNIEISDGRGGFIRIIVMAKSPGGEGNSTPAPNESIPGRYIIGKYDSGRIRAGRYQESRLRTMFSDVNLDLADFTHSSPDQPIVVQPTVPKPIPYLKLESLRDNLRGNSPSEHGREESVRSAVMLGWLWRFLLGKR